MIAQTSPQKIAGFRGSSSLEKLPELIEFQHSFSMSFKMKNSVNEPILITPLPTRTSSSKNEVNLVELTFADDVKQSNEKSLIRPNSSLLRDSADIDTINKIQRLIRFENKGHIKKRHEKLHPLQSIQYESPNNTLIPGMPGFKKLKEKLLN